MAKQIKATFTIKISGVTGNFLIEAEGPQGVEVEPHTFSWQPTVEQQKTITQLQTVPRFVSLDSLVNLGKALYQAVFTPGVAMAFGRIQQVLREEEGARVRMVVEAQELSSLPWELMHDGRDFISLRSNYPFVRGTSETFLIHRTTVRGPLRILYAWAEPKDLPSLKLETPAERIREMLADNKRIRFDILPHATLDGLRSALLEDYHILCFAGHGDEEVIYLEKDTGNVKVSAQTLTRDLEGKDTRIVFLAACKTASIPSKELAGFAQTLAEQAEVPAIVAMQYEVADDEANHLTARFFETLAAFRPVDSALSESRKSIVDEDRTVRDVFAPVLYLQVEDGALFQRSRNWIAILATILAFLGIAAFVAQTLFFQPDRREIILAQATAQAEATQRAYAVSTAQAEALVRATAEAQREEQRKIATAGELASLALDQLNTDPELGLLLALEAATYSYTEQVIDALRQLLIESKVRILLSNQIASENRIEGFSPDGKYLLTSNSSEEYRVIEVSTGATKLSITDGIYSLVSGPAFSPDGSRMAAVSPSSSSNIKVWDLSTGNILSVLNIQQGRVDSIAFSPDGKLILTGITIEDTIGLGRIWDVNTGHSIADLKGHQGIISGAAFSPDGRLAASVSGTGLGFFIPTFCCGDRSARIWSVDNGQLLKILEHRRGVNSVAFSPDGKILVTGDESGNAYIWKWETEENPILLQGHTGVIFSVAFDPNGKLVATASEDGTARIWDANTAAEVAILRGHKNWVTYISFSSDGGNVFTLSADDTVRVWEITSGQDSIVLNGHKGELNNGAFSPDDNFVITSSDDGTARIWNANTGDNIFVLEGGPGGVTGALFSPDGSWAVSSGEDQTTRIWNVKTGKEVVTLDGWISASGLTDFFNITPFSPDSKQITTVDGISAKIWDVDTGQLFKDIPGPVSGAQHAIFSPDGKYIATAGLTLPVRIIDVNTGKVVFDYCVETCSANNAGNIVNSLTFSPDGESLIVTTRSLLVDILDIRRGTLKNQLAYHENRIWNAFFSPNGETILTNDGWIRIWNANSGEIIIVNRNLKGASNSFSPDSKYIVTAVEDIAQIWEVLTGDVLLELPGHTDIISSAVFSPDGKRILTASKDGTARIFICEVCVSEQDLLLLARERTTRELTCKERQQYLKENVDCSNN